MADEATGDIPITVSIVVQMDPLWRVDRPGGAWHGDLPPYAEQMTRYLVRNLERFAEPRGADLLVVVSAKRGDEQVAHEFRSGHYVRDDAPADASGEAT